MKHLDSTFSGQLIQIDGNSYENCTFEKCKLEYSGGGLPSLVNCILVETEFVFSHQAGNTMHLLRRMYHGGFAPIVDFMIEDIKAKNSRVITDQT